jgi:hypothetical protein
MNVIHVQDVSGLLEARDVADAVEAAWNVTDGFSDVVQTIDISYVGTRLRNITANGDTIEEPWNAGTAGGTVNTETAPPSVALCYTLLTGAGGRSNRGRIFIGGVQHGLYASEQVQWALGGSPGTTIVGACDRFADELTSNGVNLHVYSRKNNTSRIVTSTRCNPGLASQRHRANRYATP